MARIQNPRIRLAEAKFYICSHRRMQEVLDILNGSYTTFANVIEGIEVREKHCRERDVMTPDK